MIAVPDYVDFLEAEYLSSFIASGGSAVKFVVADELPEDVWFARLRDVGWKHDYTIARLDASAVKVQAIEQVFFAIARQIPWRDLAAHFVRHAYEALRVPAADDRSLGLRDVADLHSYDEGELRRDLNRHLQKRLLEDYAMTQEFRVAMIRLCQRSAETDDVTDVEADAVLDWLRGDLRQLSRVKSVGIYQKIARHNARDLLFSLTHWLHLNGKTGLLIDLDIRRLAVLKRPAALEDREGWYYTKATAMDAYEMLRQLIDNTDELKHCLVAVNCAPEFLSDPARGVDSYNALKLRIYNEVHDRERDNPFASLIRLGASA